MRRTGTGLVGIAIGVAISVAALWVALRQTSLAALGDAVRGADFRYIFLAAVVYLISMGARALCWKSILGHRAPLLKLVGALNQGYLLNNLLPWRLGELGRAVLLGRYPGLSTAMVLASIAVERLYDMTLATSLLAVMLGFVPQAGWIGKAAWLAGLVIVVAGLGVWLILRRPELLRQVAARLPGTKNMWTTILDQLIAGLSAFKSPSGILSSFGWLVASWCLAVLEYWLVLKAYFPAPGWNWAPFALAVTLLGVAIPSAPGYIGVFEGAGVLALGLFGVAPASAFAFAVTLHGIYFAITTLLGATAMAAEGSTLISTVQAVRSLASRDEVPPPH
jgi:uncharacterized protein (TIRG00374 family)